ncbi:adenylosuccinate synthetase [Actinomadura sp. DC4]|uniref:adenylosuccinate synthetase n=1 Tax=Actinomadura sp. DC4 TaxID=3055069 RepID=UPI0025B1F040|nr:adenylosuccinate synthetase [Actinomadura sp. DC4]MDN3353319.1 adenylosuccinate synthetase [Actinomadura sp. DC4]
MNVIVADLGYGDAGKGTVVDWLCARGPYSTVVRFNGGAQAAHNVVTAGGRHHTFAQFGSGMFTPGVVTHLSRYMMVDPLALAAEADHLVAVGVAGAFERLTVDRDALLTTPYHRAANRARSTAVRHGSCGVGIGETASYALECDDAPRADDCRSPVVLRRRLTRLRDHVLDSLGPLDVPEVADCVDAFRAFGGRVRLTGEGFLASLLRRGPAVFEGAQGVLLDERYGFHPYTTWSTTTFANAVTLLAEAGMPGFRLGVTRAYLTRHGPGPFVTEDAALHRPEPHNAYGRWQGAFRVGHLDAVALRYALEACGGADALAVTHLDAPAPLIATAYDAGTRLTPAADLDGQARLTARLMTARPLYAQVGPDPAATIEETLGVPVALRSYGPTALDKTATGLLPGPAVSRARVLTSLRGD